MRINQNFHSQRIGEVDWGQLINQVVTTTGQIVQSANQTAQMKAQANASANAAAWGQPAYNQYSQYPTQQQSIIPGVSNTILLAGAAVAAFLILRKKRR